MTKSYEIESPDIDTTEALAVETLVKIQTGEALQVERIDMKFKAAQELLAWVRDKRYYEKASELD